ncbi:MAG: VTT domain-containing protein [bacterium]|nr:VTT domain-containing protein [bacterium]
MSKIQLKGVKAGYQETMLNILWLGLTIAAIYFFAQFLGISETRERIAAAGIWGPFIVILLKASTLVIAPLGGSPLYPIAGAAFGFWHGFIYTSLGDLLGSAIAFFISRIFGRKVVQYFVTKPGMKIIDIILAYLGTPRGLIHARLVFFSFPEGVTYAAGLTTMPFWKFLALLVPIGIGPAALLVAFGSLLSAYITAHPFLIILGYLLTTGIMAGGGYWFYRKAQSHS